MRRRSGAHKHEPGANQYKIDLATIGTRGQLLSPVSRATNYFPGQIEMEMEMKINCIATALISFGHLLIQWTSVLSVYQSVHLHQMSRALDRYPTGLFTILESRDQEMSEIYMVEVQCLLMLQVVKGSVGQTQLDARGWIHWIHYSIF